MMIEFFVRRGSAVTGSAMRPPQWQGPLTDPSKGPSVFQVEIDEVPVPKEPRKTDTGERQRSVKKFCPNPSPGFRPRLQGAHQDDQRADRPENTDTFNEIEDRIAAAAKICHVVRARDENEPANQAAQIQNAHEAYSHTQALLR